MTRAFAVLLLALVLPACGGGVTGTPPVDRASHCWPVMTDRVSPGPLPAGTRETVIGLRTDRDAVCRYAAEEGLQWKDMETAFDTTGGREHRTLLRGLEDGHTYRYFAKCAVAGTDCATPHDFVYVLSVASS